jgi:hypothetical protein
MINVNPTFRDRILSRKAKEARYASSNATSYEMSKAKVLVQLDKAWSLFQEDRPQTWFIKGKLHESMCYVTPRYGKRLLGEAIMLERSDVRETYRDLRSAIEADEYKVDILEAQAAISKSHRDKPAAKEAA